MKEQVYLITSDSGLHARPATKLVQSVAGVECDVNIEYRGRMVNLKSIMGVMSLGIPKGAEIKIIANGRDEVEAIESVEKVMSEEGLGEKK